MPQGPILQNKYLIVSSALILKDKKTSNFVSMNYTFLFIIVDSNWENVQKQMAHHSQH